MSGARISGVGIGVVALGLLTAVGACSRLPGTAEHAVAANLIDPGSARFRTLVRVKGNLCGEINGKNRMGAYTGFSPFFYDAKLEEVGVYDDPPTTSDVYQLSISNGDEFTERYLEIDDRCRFPARVAEVCGGAVRAPVPDPTICGPWLKSEDARFELIRRLGR